MIILGHQIELLKVELADPQEGRYRLLWVAENNEHVKFIAHCFGYRNTLDAAHALASGVVNKIVHPNRRPDADLSEFA